MRIQFVNLVRRFSLILLLMGSTMIFATAERSKNVLYFRNDTNEDIVTAVGYLDGSNNWVFSGYWTIGPGHSVEVARAFQRTVYVWGRGLGTNAEWKGEKLYTVTRDGRKHGFRTWDTGPNWGTFTYSFHR